MNGKPVVFALIFAACTAAIAQNTPAPAKSGPGSIHVDKYCRILPATDALPPRRNPDAYYDSAICRLTGSGASSHLEERFAGSKRRRFLVQIREQTYMLFNPTDAPVVFVVEQAVPTGWEIDSDPQPAEMQGQIAIFRPNANPGQRVELHVGMRTPPKTTKP